MSLYEAEPRSAPHRSFPERQGIPAATQSKRAQNRVPEPVRKLFPDSSGTGQPDPRQRVRSHRFPMRRSEEHTSELQSQSNLVCRLLLEKKKNNDFIFNNYTVQY